MPAVAPFRGIGYALDRLAARAIPEQVRLPGEPVAHPGRIADLSDLACPPYDVIGPDAQAALLTRHERNAVRLELNPDAADPHAAAATSLAAWLADGTLERRTDAAVYYYGHATTAQPDEPVVHGIAVRVLLEPWGSGVLPHEHTLPGPKADRLALLRATRTQLSPILAVYFDRSERYRHVSRAWSDEWRARDADGLLHQVAAVEPDERLTGYLGRQTLYVADGHHRYETALAYKAEVRADPAFADAPAGALAADWIMMVLVNAELEELEIRPTHRLILDGDAERLRDLVASPGPLWRALAMAPAELSGELSARSDAVAPVFGLILPGNEGFLLVGDTEAVDDRMRSEPASTAVRRLDLAALHAAVLDDRLGIDSTAVAAGDRLAYTRDEADALERVASGEAAAAILVRPTRLDELAAVARAGDVMPQKSTYFYPKLLTGMVFNPLED